MSTQSVPRVVARPIAALVAMMGVAAVSLCTEVARAETAPPPPELSTSSTTRVHRTHPPTQAPEPQRLFAFGIGPGAGKTALAMGGKVFVSASTDPVLVVPTYDLNVVHGLSDRFDLEFRLSSIGLLSLTDLGVRARIAGDESFAVYGKAGLTNLIVFTGSAVAVAFGATPGLGMSFGNHSHQLSVSVDSPIVMGAVAASSYGSGSAGSGAVMVRPTATWEFAVGKKTSMYLQAQAYVTAKTANDTKAGDVVPNFSIGAVW